MPRHTVRITDISPDSVVALSTMQIAGEVQIEGRTWDEFNGTVFVNMFDSRKFIQHVTETANQDVQEYFLPGNSISVLTLIYF